MAGGGNFLEEPTGRAVRGDDDSEEGGGGKAPYTMARGKGPEGVWA